MMQTTPANRISRRIRVVTLVDFLSLHGGAERQAFLIATRLDPERFESTLCVSRSPSSSSTASAEMHAIEQLADAGVRFLPLERRGKADIWIWGKLERFLRREQIDVLHSHKFGSNVWGTLTGRIAHVPVILAHEHSWSYEGQPVRRFLDREVIARGADRFIAVSRADQRRMSEVERIPPERTLFMPIGVLTSPHASSRDIRAELDIEPHTPVIGVVGMLRPQKAHHILLHATELLAREWPNIQVLLVGDGPERAALEHLARELEVQHNVQFLGVRNDVPDVLRVLDLAVCCSDFEGTPAAIVEYMDAALPVVATTVGGIPDLIEPDVNGLLVPPQDPPALADAIAKLLRAPEQARAMGARGQEIRRTKFDIDVFVHQLEELYLELLTKQTRHPR